MPTVPRIVVPGVHSGCKVNVWLNRTPYVRTAQPVHDRFISALPKATGRPLHRLVLPFGAEPPRVDVLLEAVYVEGWRYAGEFNVDDLYTAGPLL